MSFLTERVLVYILLCVTRTGGGGGGGVGGNVGEKINQFCDLPRPKETNQPGTVIDVMTFTCPVDRFSELHLPLGTGLLPFCHR